MPEHTKISFNYRKDISDYSDLVEMLFPGNRNEQTQLLLINEEGRASVYSWADSRLNFVKHLPGDNYRVALGPDMQKIESAMQHQKAMHAREICTRIKEAMARREPGDLDGLHRQLVQSGYEHVSLALRAEEYRINNDIVSGLQCSMKLMELVPVEDKRSSASGLRYAGLLETVWQPKKACSIYAQLARMHPDSNGYAEAMCRVSRQAGIIEEGNYVIGPDIPLVSLVKSATLLNEPFTGRYVVKTIRGPISCNVIVSADEFIKKHKQLCKESKTLQAERADLWWISKNRTEQVPAGATGWNIFFANPSSAFCTLKAAACEMFTIFYVRRIKVKKYASSFLRRSRMM